MGAVSFASSSEVSTARLLDSLADAGFGVGAFRPVRRTLLDTFDGRLHDVGLRLEARRSAATVLILRGGGPAPAQAAIESVPVLAGDLPVGPFRARLGPVLDVRALLPVLTLDAAVATAERRDDDGKIVVSVSLYTGLAVGSEPMATSLVAELMPIEGYAKAAGKTEKLLRSAGLSRCEGDALDLVAGRAGIDLAGFSGSPTVPLRPSEPAADGFRRVLANLADTIDANRQGVLDDTDPEFLHDLRVAVRRTRSVLSDAKGVLPRDGRDHFRSELRWLGAATTPSRDLDVYLIEWPGYVAPLGDAAAELAPVFEHISRRRAEEHATLAKTLLSARYQAVMAGWRAWIDAPEEADRAARKAGTPVGRVVAARLAEAQDRLLARGRAIGPASPADALHELRKDAKKLRYLLECFGGLLPAGPRKTFVRRLKALQDNLGEHQDTEVHTTQLRAMSEELHGAPGLNAEVFLAMGRLTELFDQRRLEARRTFAERFAAYDTPATARAFVKLLDVASKR